MLRQVSELYSFLRLNDIPLYGPTTSDLSLHPLTDLCVVSTFWLM